MINLKTLLISILIPNTAGIIANLLGNSKMGFEQINQPAFTPPNIVFPIVWIILYSLMGISSYIIYTSNNKNKKNALIIYSIQLLINTFWTLFYFNLKWFLFSFIWILLLIIFVILMFYKFYKINKTAAYLQIPYILWLIFAAILNFNVYLLNK